MNEELILSKLDGLKELFEEKFKSNDEAHKTLSLLLDKKADRWVEKAMKGAISTVLVIVIGAIMGVILVKPAYALTNYYINLIT